MLGDAVRDIRSQRYGRLVGPPGWVYAAQIDHRFIDGSLRALPVRHHQPRWRTRPETEDPDQAAADHLARIDGLTGPIELYAALDELTRLETPALTRDSFAGLSDAGCRQAVQELFDGGALNVVIVGGGPIGLAVASALKVALGAAVRVLVVEQRLSRPHHKVPYHRRWGTAVGQPVLEGLVEEGLGRVFKRIGHEANIGAPLDILETLLFLSCRRMGVKLLFAEGFDLSFIRDLPVHLVVDGSGNRLRPLPWPASPHLLTIVDSIGPERLVLDVPAMITFGVTIHPPAHDRIVTVGSHQGLFLPICKNQLIRQAMVKVLHVPARLRGELLAYLRRHNADNKFYAWPGLLHESINELLLIINLEKAEYDHLCTEHVFPLPLVEAVELAGLRASLDERTVGILELLARHATDAERAGMCLDAPFLFKPYLNDLQAPESMHGKPFLRVGDSIYNGNVKVANGLGPHLQYVRHIQETIWQAAAKVKADQVARAMGLVRGASILSDAV